MLGKISKDKRKTLYIVISVLVLSILMSFVDAVIRPTYFVKSVIKIILFAVVPMIYFALFRDEVSQMKKLFVPRKKDFFRSLAMGVAIYIVIVGGYFLLRDIIDFSAITGNLTANAGITADNFVYVATYISFVNSFLEEFFFRGFAFITLKKQTNRTFAYVLSAALFSIYHAGMTTGWYHPIVFVLGLIVLFIGGCIFNYLNEKCDNIYPSWLVHMFANFALNTVGFVLFGVL